MKTNVLMIRKIGEFDLHQRTKDSKFNATTLLRQWNDSKKMFKSVNDYMKLKSTSEFLQTIQEREEMINGESPVLKTRGRNAATWMHPVLFVDFAMWISPSFKYDALVFVKDNLIDLRHKAGDYYRPFIAAVMTLKGDPLSPSMTARILNYVVFKKHERNIRQTATQEQLDNIFDLEKKCTFLIQEKFIRTVSEFKAFLRKEWYRNHTPQF